MDNQEQAEWDAAWAALPEGEDLTRDSGNLAEAITQLVADRDSWKDAEAKAWGDGSRWARKDTLRVLAEVADDIGSRQLKTIVAVYRKATGIQ